MLQLFSNRFRPNGYQEDKLRAAQTSAGRENELLDSKIFDAATRAEARLHRQLRVVTGNVRLRDRDRNEIVVDVVTTLTVFNTQEGLHTCMSNLKDYRARDGRLMRSKVEGLFFFNDEPLRIFLPVEPECY